MVGTLDWKVLWSRGTRGRGTFRMYPLGRFPTEMDLIFSLLGVGTSVTLRRAPTRATPRAQITARGSLFYMVCGVAAAAAVNYRTRESFLPAFFLVARAAPVLPHAGVLFTWYHVFC